VALDANLVLNFDKTVDAENGNVYLYKSDDTLVQTFNVASDISGSGTTTITINPTSDLSGGETYYVKIDASAFDDTYGNSYAGIDNSTTWRFSTLAASVPDSDEDAVKAEVDSWKAYLYEKPGTTCPTRLWLEIKGDDFDDKAEVRIGGTKAYSVDVKNDERLIARFCMEKLSKVRTSLKRTISVTNPDTSKEKAKKKINLSKITYEVKNKDFSLNNPDRNLNIQKALIYLGFLDSEYATGYLGPITKTAMINFQAVHGLEQTGFLDYQTKTKLLKESN